MKTTVTVPVGVDPVERIAHGGVPYLYYSDIGQISLDTWTTLDSVIEQVNAFKERFSGEYINLHFSRENCSSCYHDCSCSPSYVLYGTRNMNDLEKDVNRRIEEIRKKSTEDRDKKEYDRLKSIYGS